MSLPVLKVTIMYSWATGKPCPKPVNPSCSGEMMSVEMGPNRTVLQIIMYLIAGPDNNTARTSGAG